MLLIKKANQKILPVYFSCCPFMAYFVLFFLCCCLMHLDVDQCSLPAVCVKYMNEQAYNLTG